jgi:hypothetical protein
MMASLLFSLSPCDKTLQAFGIILSCGRNISQLLADAQTGGVVNVGISRLERCRCGVI